MNAANGLTVDQAHVLLDAVLELRRSIRDRGLTPWDYEGDADDPKTHRVGYMALIEDLHTLASAVLA